MPKPSIKSTKGPKKPKGLPKPRATPKSESNPDLEAARRAVQEFEVQKRVLHEMKGDWNDNYPQAKLALQEILEQEDRVADAVKRAKPLVAKVKETVGDFKAQRKFSKAHYDAEEVTRLVRDHEQGLVAFENMLDAGIIRVIDLDKDAALAWFAQNPDYTEVFQPAFRGEEEMTCAVTVPKV